jgi:hypothetical protein
LDSPSSVGSRPESWRWCKLSEGESRERPRGRGGRASAE